MSDSNLGPTRDPIEALENFGTGGVPVNPLDPAAVRRLGDQRRRRQNTMYGVIAAVVVAVAVIPTALIATKGDGKASPPPITNTGSPDPTPTPPATATPTPTSKIIVFPGGGVAIKAPKDTDELVGTSEEFQAFIKTVWQKDHDAGCKTAEVDVTKYSSDGFGAGGVGGCGGYQAVWVLRDGAWKEALATQDEWVCADLARYDVPDGFAGDCYVPKPPTVIEFPNGGAQIEAVSDIAKLEGTTAAFRTFIGDEWQKVHDQGCKTPSVTVNRYTSAGFATGYNWAGGGCPGHYVLWVLQDGTWKEGLTAVSGEFTCAEFTRYQVPNGFAGDCNIPTPPPAVITYPLFRGVHVTKESDAARLEGTPEDFKQFMVSLAPDVQAGIAGCLASDPQYPGSASDFGVWVTKYAQDGYAVGEVDGCSGYAAIWKKVDGSWKQVLSGQEDWSCADLARFEIPKSFAGSCTNY